MNLLKLITGRKGIAGYDPDAQAFITAAGITDVTQKSAINQLVLDLKGYGLWSKMLAVYPMVGGTSTSCSYNLKNTSTYQITWNGSITFTNNGVASNSADPANYGDTHFNPSINFTSATNLSMGVYTGTSYTTSYTGELGVGDANNAINGNMIYACSANRFIVTEGTNYNIYSPVGELGFWSAVKDGTSVTGYRNANLLINATDSSTFLANGNIWVLGINNTNSPGYYNMSIRRNQFTYLGDALNSTEISNLYTAVQAYQTTLGRQV